MSQPTRVTQAGPFTIPTPLAKPQRPPLNLGAMTGDPEHIRARSISLVDTFSSLLSKDLQLLDAEGGSTDCKTFIKAPLADPEGYLVVEHELSHNLFGTNLPLTEEFRKKVIERLLRRAGIVATHPDATAYIPKLDSITHQLWNILEDHRCRWLWEQLYYGGGTLLKERWHDISKYEMEEAAEKDLLAYLCRKACGIETDSAPAQFKKCGPHIEKAKNLVEGVDAESCLAITARLIDDIADELLERYPPDKQEEAKCKLNALSKATAGTPRQGNQQPDAAKNPMGAPDTQLPPGTRPGQVSPQDMKRVTKLLTARADNTADSESGTSDFDALLNDGAEKMEARLEEARRAMSMAKKTPDEQSEDFLTDACIVSGIRSVFVTPVYPLPIPTPSAQHLRRELEKVRMKLKQQMRTEGDDIDTDAYIEAYLNDDTNDAPIYQNTQRSTGLELLVVVDVSGSMMGFGLDMVDTALGDIHVACKALKAKVHVWGFSDNLFIFKKIGSVKNARGLVHGCTNMVQALEVAKLWAVREKGSRAVILVTDGMPTSLRGHSSSGNALTDLHTILTEIRVNGVALSILAIGPEAWRTHYDQGFGPGQYGLLTSLADLSKALPATAKVLVESHLKKRYR